jgi:hypothetical protein
MDVDEPAVEEELLYRVVSAAARRHDRRIAILAVCAIAVIVAIAVPLIAASGQRRAAGDVDPQAAIYAAALERVAPDGATVDERSIPADVRKVLRDRVGQAVVFVTERPTTSTAGHGEQVIVFGRLVVTGVRASLPVDVRCGPLCGQGELLTLVDRHGVWGVVAVRRSWMT